MKTSNLTTKVNAVKAKIAEIELMKKNQELINIYNECGTYNFLNLSDYLNLDKQININNGALKRMIQKTFEIYYNGDVCWLNGKMVHEYIREFNKTFCSLNN